jgi:hypothetical protein
MSVAAPPAPSIFPLHATDPDEPAAALPGWQQESCRLSRVDFMGESLLVALPDCHIFI